MGRLQILPCIHIDSRDEYPVEKLLWADVVLVARPAQYHLAPDRQRLVGSVVDAFTDGWPIAEDFRKRPERLSLVNGTIEVDLYERVRPTSVTTAIRTLHRFAAALTTRPVGQRPWIAFTSDPTRRLERGRLPLTTDIAFRSDANSDPRSETFLSIDEPTSPTSLSERIGNDCAATSTEGFAFDDDGAELGHLELAADREGRAVAPLPGGTRHVLLLVRPGHTDRDCTVQIAHLRVE
ncbi:MAG: hypothetical protein ABIR79_07125 [Candidatus Binatia bacterium]